MGDSDAIGNLFTGKVCYMVLGLKPNVPYVVRAVPKVNLSGHWLKNELKTTMDVVMQAGFSVSLGFDCSNCIEQIFLCYFCVYQIWLEVCIIFKRNLYPLINQKLCEIYYFFALKNFGVFLFNNYLK